MRNITAMMGIKLKKNKKNINFFACLQKEIHREGGFDPTHYTKINKIKIIKIIKIINECETSRR